MEENCKLGWYLCGMGPSFSGMAYEMFREMVDAFQGFKFVSIFGLEIPRHVTCEWKERVLKPWSLSLGLGGQMFERGQKQQTYVDSQRSRRETSQLALITLIPKRGPAEHQHGRLSWPDFLGSLEPKHGSTTRLRSHARRWGQTASDGIFPVVSARYVCLFHSLHSR